MATLIGIELGRRINAMNVSSFLKPLFIGCVTFALAQVQLFLFGLNGSRSILISFIFGALFFVLTFIAQLLLRMSNSIKKTERKLVDMVKDVDKRVAKRIVESQKHIQFELLNNQSEIMDKVNESDKLVKDQILNSQKFLTRQTRLESADMFHQIEATIQLESVYGFKVPLPASRGWAASPDLILEIINVLNDRKPQVVVELGSGLSTIWIARILEIIGSGKLISIDHDASFADKTFENIKKSKLENFVEIRVCELENQSWNEGTENWYSKAIFKGIETIDLLIVDGPPESASGTYRWPAMWELESRMSEQATIILDDARREPEKQLAIAWSELGNYDCQIRNLEKKAAILSR